MSSTLEVEDGVLISNDVLDELNMEKMVFKNLNPLYAKSFHTIDSIYRNKLNSLSTLNFPYNRNYYEEV